MPAPRLDQLRVKQLRFVGLVASLGSLTATADQLAMTPSAASMMLKEIEGIFGAKLFVRQGRGMALTDAGRGLLPRCQTVLGEVGAMSETLLGAGMPLLRLGVFPHTTNTVLPAIVNSLVNGNPKWRLQLFDPSADRLLEMLLAGDIDLLLGRLPSHAAHSSSTTGLSQKILYQSGLAIVARKHHPLAKRSDLSIEDLLQWPWVLPNTLSTTRTALNNAFLRAGLTPPQPAVESPSYFYSRSIVANSDMLTCCAYSAAVAETKMTAMLAVSMNLESAPIALIWRKNSVQVARALSQLSLPDTGKFA